jgi:hypothetical protein
LLGESKFNKNKIEEEDRSATNGIVTRIEEDVDKDDEMSALWNDIEQSMWDDYIRRRL